MELILGRQQLNQCSAVAGCVLSIGTFDGMHLGHQALLHKLQDLGREHALKTVVITFYPTPKEYFSRFRNENECHSSSSYEGRNEVTHKNTNLMTLRSKISALTDFGVDKLICFKFNKELADITAENFVKDFLVDKLKIKYLVVGQDFRLGKGGVGDITLLQKLSSDYGFSVICVADLLYGKDKISSSLIKNVIIGDELELAAKLLGRPYSLTGTIIANIELTKKLGMPTINIQLNGVCNVPLRGVYLVKVIISQDLWFYGIATLEILSIIFEGSSPHSIYGIYTRDKLRFEIQLFDLSDAYNDLQDKVSEIQFLHKIRKETSRLRLNEEQQQINLDITTAKQWLAVRS